MAEKKEKISAFEKVQSERKSLVDKIIANMEKGYIWDSGWDINALRSQNPVSGAKYNGINKLHLGYAVAENNYQDPRFVTFKQAQEKGWKVKKGEHGYPCEYWIWTKKEEITNDKGEKEKVDVPLDKPRISYFTVFNLEQIEGDYPKFELPKLQNDEILQIANDLIASSRCPIQEAAQDRAYYSPSNDKITLPLRDSFKSTEDYLATLLHEMAHSTGKELGREMSTLGKMSSEYAKEELVAELSSLFLKAELGIPSEGKHFENHSAYLNGWNSMLRSDPNELYRAAKEADKACVYIMDRYREYINTKEITKEEIKEKTTKKVEGEKEVLNADKSNEYWRIEFNETIDGVVDYSNKILTKELLEEIKQIDKEVSLKEMGDIKFYFEHIKDGEIVDRGRINVGSNEVERFKYLANELEKLKITKKELSTPKIANTKDKEPKTSLETKKRAIRSRVRTKKGLEI